MAQVDVHRRKRRQTDAPPDFLKRWRVPVPGEKFLHETQDIALPFGQYRRHDVSPSG
jgi:hypothetical protein